MGLVDVKITYKMLFAKTIATGPLWAFCGECRLGKDKTELAQVLHDLACTGPT